MRPVFVAALLASIVCASCSMPSEDFHYSSPDDSLTGKNQAGKSQVVKEQAGKDQASKDQASKDANGNSAEPLKRTAESGKRQFMGFVMLLNPDCTSMGAVDVKVTKEPQNGQITVEQGDTYPNYPKDNARSACNAMKVPGTLYYYTSKPDFSGVDSVSLELTTPGGVVLNKDYVITVLP